ncbi:Transcription termination factor 3, partial [Fasciolopsis buskii]
NSFCPFLCWSKVLRRAQASWIYWHQFSSASSNSQEEYVKSLIQAFIPPDKSLNAAQTPTADSVPVETRSRRRLRLRWILLHSDKLERQPARKMQRKWDPSYTNGTVPVELKPSAPIELPIGASFGPYEPPEEGLVPISSAFHSEQTISDSVKYARNWFKKLDFNTLTVPVLPTGNLAPYVSRSFTLQQLVLLGVDLSKIEHIPGVANMLVKMDFQQTIEPLLWDLNDLGFDLNQIARLLTRFPKLLKLPRDELFRRFIYFIQQGFTQSETVRLIDAQPLVLSFTSPEVDRHLGQVQTLFRFSAPQVRLIVNEVPAVLVHPLARIKDTYVLLSKMLGYPDDVCRTMACSHPKLLLTERRRLVSNFVFMHMRLDLSLDLIQMWPEALSAAPHLLPQRTAFLVRRNLFQPDPKQPLYTPLNTVVKCTDREFCELFGRTTEAEYNLFLKTL